MIVILSDSAREVLEGVIPGLWEHKAMAEAEVPGYHELIYRLERLLERDGERRRRAGESTP